MRLIDAEELKNAIMYKTGVAYETWNELYDSVLEEIDNAPTVDIKDIYQEGYYDGHLEGYTKAINERRPQGEWIRKVDKAGFISHICSECGAEIEVEDPEDDRFCFNCGAYMKGGAE